MTSLEQIVIRHSVLVTSPALTLEHFFLGSASSWQFIFEGGLSLNEGLICIAIGIACLYLCLREMADRRPYIIT